MVFTKLLYVLPGIHVGGQVTVGVGVTVTVTVIVGVGVTVTVGVGRGLVFKVSGVQLSYHIVASGSPSVPYIFTIYVLYAVPFSET